LSTEEIGESHSTAIEIRDLTKGFPGVVAVDGLSLTVRRGEVFGFLGPNGAGKTTSIKMMVGLLKPTSGQVRIEGEAVEAASKGVKRKIGVCPQDIVLWERLTCMENLLLISDMYEVPKKEGATNAARLLEDLKLADKKDTHAAKLSGGMKRRLNVAMALVHDPGIVVLDEPTAGLDPQSRLVVTDYIRRLKKEEEKTIILTTHMMEIADQLSDRVAIIDHGKLLALEAPENMKDRIGKGDVLEITLFDQTKNGRAVEELKKMDGIQETEEIRDKIVIRALDLAGRLPGIFNSLEVIGAKVLDVSLRRNSLEDVFITLTGRGLRE
jgi:ABC-2 type transport system ATP-binding protein